MSYVDAGYAIVLVVLTLYALSLLARRRRMERATSEARDDGGMGDAGGLGAPATHHPRR